MDTVDIDRLFSIRSDPPTQQYLATTSQRSSPYKHCRIQVVTLSTLSLRHETNASSKEAFNRLRIQIHLTIIVLSSRRAHTQTQNSMGLFNEGDREICARATKAFYFRLFDRSFQNAVFICCDGEQSCDLSALNVQTILSRLTYRSAELLGCYCGYTIL
jgi:hypothetical protein